MVDLNATLSPVAADVTASTARSSSTDLPPPPSEKESKWYYAGLPSLAILVARTTTTPFEMPSGPDAQWKLKYLDFLTGDSAKFREAWEDHLWCKVRDVLSSMQVNWTCLDVFRIKTQGEHDSDSPPILWIGVMPGSLSGKDGVAVAYKCRDLIAEEGFNSVEVEIREAVVSNLVYIASSFDPEPIVDVHRRLVAGLNLPAPVQPLPWADGISMDEEDEAAEKHIDVTARHIVFTPKGPGNRELFWMDKDRPQQYNITLFDDLAFKKYMGVVKIKVEEKAALVQRHEERLQAIKGNDDPDTKKVRKEIQVELDEAEGTLEQFRTLLDGAESTQWAALESFTLGHVLPFDAKPDTNTGNVFKPSYTGRWTIIDIEESKNDAGSSNGTAIDLGSCVPADWFTRMMCPCPRNPHSFTYPSDRLLKLKGTVLDTSADLDFTLRVMNLKRYLSD